MITNEAISANTWDKEETTIATIFTVATVVDWGQTRDMVKRQTQFKKGDVRYEETNIILGETPSMNAVDNYIPLAIGSTLLVAHMLPKKYRKSFLYLATMVEFMATTNNHQRGLKVDFRY